MIKGVRRELGLTQEEMAHENFYINTDLFTLLQSSRRSSEKVVDQ